MESGTINMYPFSKVDAKDIFDTYFSSNCSFSMIKETTTNMIQAFHNAFASGLVCGDSVLDLSFGPIIYPHLAINEFVKEFIMVELNDCCTKLSEQWMNKDPNACDWSHTIDILSSITGLSDPSEDEEDNLRDKIRQVCKWNHGDDPLPVQQCDVGMSIWGLDILSKNHEEYRKNLRKLCEVIKPGGYILIYGSVNATYFKIGKEKLHYLKCDESFYRKVLCEEGLDIKHCETFPRVMKCDTVDHEGILFMVCQKVNP
ncbi:hypothetical protein PRIEUP_LOCUS1371 [Pristimantis euphronides]